MYTAISVYDPNVALATIDANKDLIQLCLNVAAGFSFVYFLIGIRMAVRQKVYVVPFLGASWFLWHDLSYVLHYPLWTSVYNSHWWLMQWTWSQVGTVALEAFLLWQFIHYGHRELMPEVSKRLFATLTVLATVGVGAIWWLVKASMADELYLISQAITVPWSIPFHTGVMLRRKSRAGQSIAMQICVLAIFVAMSIVGVLSAPGVFTSAPYIAFFSIFSVWALVNVWLIRRYPPVYNA